MLKIKTSSVHKKPHLQGSNYHTHCLHQGVDTLLSLMFFKNRGACGVSVDYRSRLFPLFSENDLKQHYLLNFCLSRSFEGSSLYDFLVKVISCS